MSRSMRMDDLDPFTLIENLDHHKHIAQPPIAHEHHIAHQKDCERYAAEDSARLGSSSAQLGSVQLGSVQLGSDQRRQRLQVWRHRYAVMPTLPADSCHMSAFHFHFAIASTPRPRPTRRGDGPLPHHCCSWKFLRMQGSASRMEGHPHGSSDSLENMKIEKI